MQRRDFARSLGAFIASLPLLRHFEGQALADVRVSGTVSYDRRVVGFERQDDGWWLLKLHVLRADKSIVADEIWKIRASDRRVFTYGGFLPGADTGVIMPRAVADAASALFAGLDGLVGSLHAAGKLPLPK